MPEINLTISRGYLTVCEGQHMNSFTSAAACLLNLIYGQGILQDTARLWVELWFLTPHSFWEEKSDPTHWILQYWYWLSLIFVHLNHQRSFQEQRQQTLERRSSRINLIGMLQLPAVQVFAKILKYLQTNFKKFLLETYTSQTTRKKISMS